MVTCDKNAIKCYLTMEPWEAVYKLKSYLCRTETFIPLMPKRCLITE